MIMPRIINLLQESQYPAYRRAAAFALSQMLTVDGGAASQVMMSVLHDPILQDTPDTESMSVGTTLNTLTVLITNSDPSPILINTLLSPTVASLYGLLFHLDSIRISDPELKETVRGLLMTWFRIVSASEAMNALWHIFDEEAGQWQTNLEGHVRRVSG